jgi:cell division protein FtsL
MPAFQSTPEFDLSAKYHLRAVGCERQAEHATDQTTEQEWRELAAQWHSMADQATVLSGDASRAD